jgi:trimeric autotransporter adhesin
MRWITPLITTIALLCMAAQCFQFETSTLLSTVTLSNQTSTSVDAESVLLDFTGAVTQHGHLWSKSPNPILGFNSFSSLQGGRNERGSFTSNITNLESSTTYFVRAYAIVDGQTYYGKDAVFSTNSGGNKPPEYVNTLGISNISPTAATASGDIAKLTTGSTVTQYGHCWATTPSPTTANSKTEKGTRSDLGNYSSDLTGLSAGTKYYLRAYMRTSASGTTILYGNETTFTTPN